MKSASFRSMVTTLWLLPEDYDSYTTTDERLEAHYADGEYYNVETSNPYLYDFDLIF